MIGPPFARLVRALTDDGDQQVALLEALALSLKATTGELSSVQDAYALVGYWYSVSKDRKRRAKAAGEREATLDWQLYEDLLEAAVKALNSGLIVSQHLGKRERYTT